MTTILERAVEHAKMLTMMSDEEFAAIMHRDADLPIAGDDLSRILASGALKHAGNTNLKAAIKHEIVPSEPRVHNVILEEHYSTEDLV